MIVFVVPEPGARISGGNLYNLGLTGALAALGERLSICDAAGAEAALAEPVRACVVDSLYLELVPRLARRARVCLLAHWLPSLVAAGGVPAALADDERAALAAADLCLAPSRWMAEALLRLGARAARVVAPALPAAPLCAPTAGAVLVANLVAGKGVLPLLRALPGDARLTIVGDGEQDPDHAAACRAAAGPGVVWRGALPHAETLALIAAADCLVSASRMESYGMALAEARALGVPLLALAGGNAAAHVEARAGGRLVGSHAELAAELTRLQSDAGERALRRRLAQAALPPPRSWAEAARDLLAAL